MSHRIPDLFLDSLKSRLELSDLIQSYGVSLKKAGANFTGLCPFHNEKSPSFSVNNDKQFYYCFGCGANGDAIKFVSEHTGMPFRETVKQLAAQVGMEVPQPDSSKENAAKEAQRAYQKKLEALMESAATWFQAQLQTDAGSLASHYLSQTRKLSSQTLAQYGVGYAPDQWDALKNHLLSQGYTDQMLIDTGMVSVQEGQNHTFDRFRNRVIFPIRNNRGKVVAFGGRVLDDSKPKYLNSPETQLYNKSTEVYGLIEARRNTRVLSRLLVVEGYMDVTALADAGITYATAPLGTAITEQQINKLLRSSSSLVFCFDGDEAGQKAALKALNIIAPKMLDARDFRFMFIPEGKDPDDLLQKVGVDAFNQMIYDALPALDYILKRSLGDLNLDREGDKVAYAMRIAEWVHKLPRSLHANKLLQIACTKTGLTEQALLSSFKKETERSLMALPKVEVLEQSNDLKLLMKNLYTLFGLLWSRPEVARVDQLSSLGRVLGTLLKNTKEEGEALNSLNALINDVESLSRSIINLLHNRIRLTQTVLHYYWHDTPLLGSVEGYQQAAKDWLTGIPEKPEATAAMLESIIQWFTKKANKIEQEAELEQSDMGLAARFELLRKMKMSEPLNLNQ